MTEYSQAPTEPNSAPPGSAAESSTLSRDEQAEPERRLRVETDEEFAAAKAKLFGS